MSRWDVTVEAVPKKDIDNAIDRIEELMLCYRDAGLTGEVIGMKVALEILKRGKDRNA